MKILSASNLNFRGSIYGDVSKGKKEFEELSREEQLTKLAVEKLRREFNSTAYGFQLSPLEGDLNGYVRYRIAIGEAMKKVLAKFRLKK